MKEAEVLRCSNHIGERKKKFKSNLIRYVPILWVILSFSLGLFGCEFKNSPVDFDIISLPEGGNISQLAETRTAKGETKLYALAANRIFQRGESGWKSISAPENFLNATTTLLSFKDSLYAFSPATHTKPNALLRSRDGVHWSKVRLPRKARFAGLQKSKVKTATRAFRVLDKVKLHIFEDSFALVHSHNIWKGFLETDTIVWKSLNLEGLPFGLKRDSHLPPSIRNYLPATDTRKFELITVLSEQLLIFRRNISEDSWVLTATLPTADTALIAEPNGQSTFLVSNDSIYRSDDQSEQWFKMGPVGKGFKSFTTYVTNEKLELFVGNDEGEIWRFKNENWENIVPKDLDRRSIRKFLLAKDTIFVGTAGRGVLRFTEEGFIDDNTGLTAAIPNDIEIVGKKLLVSTSNGVFYRENTRWKRWSDRSATFLQKGAEHIMVGTQNGDLITGSLSAPPFIISPPFGKKSVWFETELKTRTPLAITHIGVAPNEGRVIIWSEHHGAVSNAGQSSNWQQITLISQFEEILNTSAVVDFGIATNALFIVEKSTFGFRLWKSDAQATSWQEISRFDQASSVVLAAMNKTSENLVLIKDGNLILTTDGGERWVPMAGPWQAYKVLGTRSYARDKLGILARTSRRLEFYSINRISPNPKFESHLLIGTQDIDENVRFAVEDDDIVLGTPSAIYIGKIRTQHDRFSFGSSMLITGILSLLFAAIAFIGVRLFAASKEI